tara:strand:+ start:386 stop:628 length:243 start_codon:yes stop_codon:yes gene_type:complete
VSPAQAGAASRYSDWESFDSRPGVVRVSVEVVEGACVGWSSLDFSGFVYFAEGQHFLIEDRYRIIFNFSFQLRKERCITA